MSDEECLDHVAGWSKYAKHLLRKYKKYQNKVNHPQEYQDLEKYQEKVDEYRDRYKWALHCIRLWTRKLNKKRKQIN